MLRLYLGFHAGEEKAPHSCGLALSEMLRGWGLGSSARGDAWPRNPEGGSCTGCLWLCWDPLGDFLFLSGQV